MIFLVFHETHKINNCIDFHAQYLKDNICRDIDNILLV